MRILEKAFLFLKRLLDKIIHFIWNSWGGGYKKLLSRNPPNEVFEFGEIKDFVYHPLKTNYLNKILFVESDFQNLYSIYKLIDKKYCDYILLKNNKDFNNIKKIFDYKIVVVNSELRFLDKISKKHQIVVCVWHALGAFKKVGKYNSKVFRNLYERKYYESFFDFLIVSGSEIVNLYSDAFNMEKKFVLPLGLPQTDKYFDNDFIKKCKKDFLSKFNFLKNKKIYGFFPTFQEKKWGIYWNINFKKIANLLNDDEVIVFKLHPTVSIDKSDFYEVENKIIDLSHVKNLISLCEFEAIITDYSSTMFEAMFFNINLVFLRNRQVELERDLWVKYENLPGIIIDSSSKEYKKNPEKIILKNLRIKNQKSNYKKFFEENIGNCDSNNSKRIANFLLEKLEENKI